MPHTSACALPRARAMALLHRAGLALLQSTPDEPAQGPRRGVARAHERAEPPAIRAQISAPTAVLRLRFASGNRALLGM